MRKLLILIILVLAVFWVKDFVQSGKLVDYLDRHPNPSLNAPLEYYWGALLELGGRTSSAMYHLQRVQEKYADTPYGPLAWVERIDILDTKEDRNRVLEEGKQFLEAYPKHLKTELIRKKLSFIEHGY